MVRNLRMRDFSDLVLYRSFQGIYHQLGHETGDTRDGM